MIKTSYGYVFDDEAVRSIAKKAIEKKTGARALRAVIEEFMLDIMYEIPKDDLIGRVTITEDYINNSGAPKIEMRGSGEAKILTQRELPEALETEDGMPV